MEAKERREKAYSVLNEFLDSAGMSNREFARYAGIKEGSFQSMITRKGGMKDSTIDKVDKAMMALIDEAKDEDEALFYDMLLCRNEFMKNICRPMKSIFTADEIAAVLADRVAEVVPNFDVSEVATPRSRLLDAFNQLNEKGQETAAERVQELTQIESYRKKED